MRFSEDLEKEIKAMDYETSFSKLLLDIGENLIDQSPLPDQIKSFSSKLMEYPRKTLQFFDEKGWPII